MPLNVQIAHLRQKGTIGKDAPAPRKPLSMVMGTVDVLAAMIDTRVLAA